MQHAERYVPFYREALRERRLGPGDFRTAADLAQLPLIERSDLQADPLRFLSTARPREELIEMRTGGTSGRPITIYRDPAALFAAAAHQERRRRPHLQAAGKRLRLRQITLTGERSTRGLTVREFSRHSLVPQGIRLLDEAYSMFDPPELQVERIERFRPDTIAGYGSCLEALFDHIEMRGGIGHLPSALLYSGDAISERGRRRLPEIFGVQLFSSYSAVEAFHIGFECEEHAGFHINTDLYPLRLVDAAGCEVPEGRSGEVVISNLVNRGTMLLNYRLADEAHWIGEPCRCGRAMPLLSFIEGRFDDWLELDGGRLLHPQAIRELFTGEGALVRSYQVEQVSSSGYLLRIVLTPSAASSDQSGLQSRLRAGLEAVAAATDISFQYVERIPRTERGKLRTVVSAASSRRTARGSSSPKPPDASVIEPAEASDLDAILEVMASANMHHIGSAEMPALDLERFFVVRQQGRIVGAAGWELVETELGKTTLLAVLPEARGAGLGERLQLARMEAMRRAGARRVRTNADRPDTIAWYCERFGYEKVGELAKVEEFGDPAIDSWTTLEAPLKAPAGDEALAERSDHGR